MDKCFTVLYNQGMITIDSNLITYLEDLSCLTLSDAEKSRLTGDLQDILHGMDKLSELDTTGVPERSHPFDDVNAFRPDEVKPSLAREAILQNAAKHNEEAFIAPKTVE
jgi:aspartyl-tRNA(Asn)/glutamyl-tRNA(Gln) amidotransferase subunit C